MHRAHHYPKLIERWKQVAAKAGLRLQKIAMVGKLPMYLLRTPALEKSGGIYISAGIHGDEPASTEATLAWAQQQGKRLRDLPLFILPCLNPWGLINNRRSDEQGRDLNRSFHLDEIPELLAVRRTAEPYQFELAMTLHEDYDGEGIYLYEVQRAKPYWGESLLEAVQGIIPIESRPRVDNFKSKLGVIRRRLNMRRFDVIGYPEAIWLHVHHAERTFTVETPSEFAIEQRIAAHVAVLQAAVKKVVGA